MEGGGSNLPSKVELSNITGSGVERRLAVGGAEPPQTHQKNLMFFAMFVFFILEISPRKDTETYLEEGGQLLNSMKYCIEVGPVSNTKTDFNHKLLFIRFEVIFMGQ